MIGLYSRLIQGGMVKKRLLLGALALGLFAVVVPNKRIVEIEGEFLPEMVTKVSGDLSDSLVEDSPQLVIVNSPGGMAHVMFKVIDMVEGTKYSSFTPAYAASCAAQLALGASGTIFANEDAEFLLHSASVMGLNQGMLEDIVGLGVVPIGFTLSIEQLKDILKGVTELNNKMLDSIAKRHPKLDREFLRKEIYGDMRHDKRFKASELVGFGFDIVLRKPDMREFTTMPVMRILHSLLSKTVDLTWFFRSN